jgi:hypothetical protein
LNKISIPKTLKIGGFDYNIDITHDADLRADGCYGQCKEMTRSIAVDSSISEQQFSHTFLHEMLHAVDSVYGINSVTEEQNKHLAQGLFQVMEELGIRFTPAKVVRKHARPS